MRVFRHDTRAWADVPEESLLWGPDTKQATCRVQLLRGPWFRDARLFPGDVPYILPFSGSKWAIRVDLPVAGKAEPGFSDRWFRAKSVLEANRPGSQLLRVEAGLLPAGGPSRLSLHYAWADGEGGRLWIDGLEADWIWSGCASRSLEPVSVGDSRLEALLRAAADALAVEPDEEPDALGQAMELLVEALSFIGYCGPAGDLRDRIRDLLHRETLSHG